MTKNTKKLILEHYKTHPNADIQDFFKFLHQSSFGCEHIITDCFSAEKYIETEYENISKSKFDENLITPLDGNYVRIDLAYITKGISAKTLAKLLFLSAKKEENGQTFLEEKLKVFADMIKTNELPFSLEAFNEKKAKWQNDGYPAIHHSDKFRSKYAPHYRVISKEFVHLLPFFAKIDSLDKSTRKIVAIEGGSASGKTTLGRLLEKLYDCTLLHTDDFFLRPEQRTPERFAEVGGNLDRERLLEEVLQPIKTADTLRYKKFDCSKFCLTPPVTVGVKNLIFIEGAYSMHPAFESFYDMSLFIDIDEQTQRERILVRNGEFLANRFFNEWIPREKTYFKTLKIKERCSLVINTPKKEANN